jgi:hypothetical protein
MTHGWYHHPEQGSFCPLGCHMRITACHPEAIKYGREPTELLPTCGIVIARELMRGS